MELSSFYSFFNPFGCNLDKYDDLYLTILLSISPDLPKMFREIIGREHQSTNTFFFSQNCHIFRSKKNSIFNPKLKKNQFHILIKNLQDFFACVSDYDAIN